MSSLLLPSKPTCAGEVLRKFFIQLHVNCWAASVSVWSEDNNCGSRFRDICINYIHICLSVHALHKTMHTLRKFYHLGPMCIVLQYTGCCSKHHFEDSNTLRSGPLLGMADCATSAEDSPDDYSNLSRTCTATGQKKCSSSQSVTQREERLAAKWLRHIPFLYYFFILYMDLPYTSFSLLYMYSHFLRITPLLLLIFQIHKLLHGWGARHVFAHCVCLVTVATQSGNLLYLQLLTS